MSAIETILMYVDCPETDFSDLASAVNERLGDLGPQFTQTPDSADSSSLTILTGGDLQVELRVDDMPLPAERFQHAMDSPLSAPFQGMLSDILFRHRKSISVSVFSTQPMSRMSAESYLTLLRVTHAAATCVAQWQRPAAVLWAQSNQLITGAQYAQLADDNTPWALFAQARVFSKSTAPQDKRRQGLRLDEAAQFIDRPILFVENDFDIEHSYAAALSFLRHAVETGAPIPDGDTFGQQEGYAISVKHCPPSAQLPSGHFELALIDLPRPELAMQADTADTVADHNGMDLPGPADLTPDPVRLHQAERRRSLAISYLMLLLVPPVGLLLLLSNLIFGSNAARTGLIASTSVALVILVGAFTFLQLPAQKVATLSNTTISTERLAD